MSTLDVILRHLQKILQYYEQNKLWFKNCKSQFNPKQTVKYKEILSKPPMPSFRM